MATLINLDALRGLSWDDLLRRVHQDKETIVIEDLTMPVAALVDIDQYQRMSDMQQAATPPASSTEPMIRGSDVSIRELAQWHVKGDTAEGLQRRFPMLSAAQIYTALAYYYEHTADIDRLITQHNQG